MPLKHRHSISEPIPNSDNINTLKQLERILLIRKNRKEKNEAKTRELRRILEAKQTQLTEREIEAKQFEVDAKEKIQQLSKSNINRTLRINEVLCWSNKEESIKMDIQKTYDKCDSAQIELDSARLKLTMHLQVYKKSVIDYEKILIIKRELESQEEG